MGKDMKRPFEFTGRIRSIRYAGRGILLTLRSQHNAWIHAAATVAVVAIGFYLEITREEWCLIVLACAAVWTAETLNTAFEFLADVTTKEFHPVIGYAKDMAAGAVLITAFGPVIIGLLVFGPYLIRLIH
jgi:diacylglycerol kinase (ATP)